MTNWTLKSHVHGLDSSQFSELNGYTILCDFFFRDWVINFHWISCTYMQPCIPKICCENIKGDRGGNKQRWACLIILIILCANSLILCWISIVSFFSAAQVREEIVEQMKDASKNVDVILCYSVYCTLNFLFNTIYCKRHCFSIHLVPFLCAVLQKAVKLLRCIVNLLWSNHLGRESLSGAESMSFSL